MRTDPATGFATRQVDQGRYQTVRDRTERLADPLGPEDQVVQSMPDCSPTKWHRAHTTWFFETFVLGPHHPGHITVDPTYTFLFNSYYEAVGPRQPRPRRGLITRPTVEQIREYRRRVDDSMAELLGGGDHHPETDLIGALVELGLHHEQQHQELLLMDAKHLLFQNPLRPAYQPRLSTPELPAPAAGWVDHPGGLVEIGANGSSFIFDNEAPRHHVYLPPFQVADRLVTCGEWQAFIDDGGYSRPELWLSDGWAAVCTDGWTAPLYWESDEAATTSVFTLAGPQPLDSSEPVIHVSYYEADAFARWAGARLPTEHEWEAVFDDRRTAAPASSEVHPWRGRAVGEDPHEAFSTAWQWTASAYSPYPGFRSAEGAIGEYNGKFMVNQHVLRGGACVTPAGHTRATYRNFYPPASRWAFSGVRLARDD